MNKGAETVGGKGLDKKVIISDLHMNDERALHGSESEEYPYPYAWLRANIPVLCAFLDEQLAAGDVQVVVAGDMFDGWTIPAEFDPALPSTASSPFYERICEAGENEPIVSRFRDLARENRFTYVAGNHDMMISKDFMKGTFPGVNFAGSAEPGWRVHRDGHLVVEHGHEYEPFCATDDWTVRPDSMPQYLPLGYYMSRVVNHKVCTKGKHEDVLDILATFAGQVLKGNLDISEDVLLSTTEDSGLNEYSLIDVGDGASVYVIDAGRVYGEILREWGRHVPTQAKELEMVFGGLDGCIHQEYFKPGTGVNVAICGHTHVPLLKAWGACCWDRLWGKCPLPASHVYANSGTWIDFGHPPTYVETEKKVDENRTYVRLKSYARDGLSKTMKEAYVPCG
jgi:UDP-2,3-diacylglucosamine pyrophosphatase LpxH